MVGTSPTVTPGGARRVEPGPRLGDPRDHLHPRILSPDRGHAGQMGGGTPTVRMVDRPAARPSWAIAS